MDLNSRLTEIRDRSRQRAPEDVKLTMMNSADKLAAMDFDVVKVGDSLPGFKLKDVDGKWLTNEDITKPTIITFYRGGW